MGIGRTATILLLGILSVHLALASEPDNKAVRTGANRARIHDPLAQQVNPWKRPPQDILWGFHNMYQACVVEVGDLLYPYRMWFFGWATADGNPGVPGCDAIYHARSRDLEKWEVWSGAGTWDMEMTPSTWAPVVVASDRPYDAWHNGDPSVVYREGRYYMAYSATSKPGFKKSHDHLEGQLLCIMGAVSQDGITWTKTDAPLLIESEEAIQAATTAESVCDFHRPCLRWHEGKWKLWFDYWNHPHGCCLGYAENTGEFGAPRGFQVKHDLRTEPLIRNWPNPEIAIVNGRYHAFGDPPGYPAKQTHSATARAWSSRALCEAVSDDGWRWSIVGYLPPDDDAAACHVPQTLITTIDGERRLYLFYATQRGGNPTYDFRYDRIRATWRQL